MEKRDPHVWTELEKELRYALRHTALNSFGKKIEELSKSYV